MLEGVLNPFWLQVCLVYAKLRLWNWTLLSFIISLLYLTKSKFHRSSFCVIAEQHFHVLDIIITS